MQTNQSAPLSSQEYLRKIRQQRIQHRQANPPQSQSQPPTPPQPQLQPQPRPQFQSFQRNQSAAPFSPQPPTTLPQPPIGNQPPSMNSPQPGSAPQPVNQPQPNFTDQNLPYQDSYTIDPNTRQVFDSNGQVVPLSAFQESQLFPGQFNPIPEETILEWKAPNRPYKKRNRQYYTTVVTIVFLVSLILFFAGQFLPIAVVISVGFIAYALSAIPPIEVTNKITTWGIRIEKEIFYWEELGRYWFETKFKQKMLLVETARFPNRITLMLNNRTEQELEQLLSEVLIKQKPDPTMIDKAAKWLQEKFPLDNS